MKEINTDKMKTCKLCGANLRGEPIFSLHNVPKAAQHLPTKDKLESDAGIDLSIYQCTACSLVQLMRPPVPYFKEVITSAFVSTKMRLFRLHQLADFVNRFGLTDKKVIEIGCGEGFYLDLLTELGVSALGLEASSKARTRGNGKGRNILSGYVEKGSYIDGQPFDGFIMINFLEHAPYPRDLLNGIYNNLASGAVGLVEVPSFEHVVKTRRFYDFVPDHMSYFSEKSFQLALEISGFEVLDCRMVWDDYDIAAYVRKREKINLDGWNIDNNQLVNELSIVVQEYGRANKKVAVWGASHQALTLLALSKLDQIKYIIDSAPFKQGHYSPVMCTPIVSPDRLKDDKVDAIIVMAAGYSDEVIKTLKTEMAFDGAIAVLKGNRVEVIQQGN
jgi:SAM-dependent methyltransferase